MLFYIFDYFAGSITWFLSIKCSVNRRRWWHPTPVLLPGKSHGQRSLVGGSPWGSEELDMTEQLHFHFSLSCIGEENGNPLQYSCLKNPRDGRAWWAAVYGVAQNRTRLKQLSSSTAVYFKPIEKLEPHAYSCGSVSTLTSPQSKVKPLLVSGEGVMPQFP